MNSAAMQPAAQPRNGFGPFEVIAFDCDGVLFDSKEANVRFYSHILEHIGQPPVRPEQQEFIHMHPVRESLRFLVGDGSAFEAAWTYAQSIDFEEFNACLRPEPGLVDLLEADPDLLPYRSRHQSDGLHPPGSGPFPDRTVLRSRGFGLRCILSQTSSGNHGNDHGQLPAFPPTRSFSSGIRRWMRGLPGPPGFSLSPTRTPTFRPIFTSLIFGSSSRCSSPITTRRNEYWTS